MTPRNRLRAKKPRHACGFTFVELLAVICIMALCVFAAAGPLKNRSDTERAEQTRTVLAELRTALLGQELPREPRTRDDGYIPDMGELPELIGGQPRGLWTPDTNNDGENDLLRRTQFLDETHDFYYGFAEESTPLHIWMGWRGPYISVPKDGVLRDGWGNALIFQADTATGDLTVISPGANGIVSAQDSGADSDITMVIRRSEYTAPVAGIIIPSSINSENSLADVEVRLYYAAPDPTKTHVRVTHLVSMEPQSGTIAEDGYFLFKEVPVGTDRLLEISQPLPPPNSTKKTLTYLRFEVLPTLNWLGRLDIRNSYEVNNRNL
jgi:type II secretory pathway pseudopilin PulG